MSPSITRSLTWLKSTVCFWFAAGLLPAADLKVYSEFRRIGPDGEIVASDRGGAVREILSPRALRGGWTSYQIVVEAPPGTEFWLYLGQNPEGAAKASLYRATFSGGIPHTLEPVTEPAQGKIPPGQQAAVFWLDLLYPKDGPAGRVKLEPQLFLSEEKRWIIYPMEVNVTPVRSQVVMESVSAQASPAGRADDIALAIIKAQVCPGVTLPPAKAKALTVRDRIERNARQDVALMRRLPPAALAGLIPAGLCDGSVPFPPEGMIGIRDRMYKLLQESSKLKETDP